MGKARVLSAHNGSIAFAVAPRAGLERLCAQHGLDGTHIVARLSPRRSNRFRVPRTGRAAWCFGLSSVWSPARHVGGLDAADWDGPGGRIGSRGCRQIGEIESPHHVHEDDLLHKACAVQRHVAFVHQVNFDGAMPGD